MKTTTFLLSTFLFTAASTCQAHWNAWDASYTADHSVKLNRKYRLQIAGGDGTVRLCWIAPAASEVMPAEPPTGGGGALRTTTPSYGYFVLSADLDVLRRDDPGRLGLYTSNPRRFGPELAKFLSHWSKEVAGRKELAGTEIIVKALARRADLPLWRFSVHWTHKKGSAEMANAFEMRLIIEIISAEGGAELNNALKKLFCEQADPIEHRELAKIVQKLMKPYLEARKISDPIAIPVLEAVFGKAE